MMEENNENLPVEKRSFFKKEVLGLSVLQWIITCIVIIALASSSMLACLSKFSDREISVVGYTFSLEVLINSFIVGVLLSIGMTFIMSFLPWFKKGEIKNFRKNIIWEVILLLCGVLAHMVLSSLLVFYLSWPALLVFPLVSIIVLVYVLLVYYLCILDRMESRSKFWEIFRFALVGALAAVFDFVICSFVRFVCFKSKPIPDMWISVISVLCGFTISVIINYLCSISIVFKNKDGEKNEKDISKTPKGIILFIILGAIGLGLGFVLEIIFFDICHLPEPICFVIRTIIVLIWNYISRKLFIFRN